MPRTGDQIKENIHMAVGGVKEHLGHLMKNEKMSMDGAQEKARAKENLEQIHSETSEHPAASERQAASDRQAESERQAESAVRNDAKRPSISGGFGSRVREAVAEVTENVRSLGHKKE